MLKFIKALNLQFFADGASGGDGAAPSGESNPAAAEQTSSLEEMGVPDSEANWYRNKKGKTAPPAHEPVAEPTPEPVARSFSEDDISKMSLKEFLKMNPEASKENQAAFSKRIKEDKAYKEATSNMLGLLGKKYGINVSDSDLNSVKALSDAISNDTSYYEDYASELGTDVETAMRIKQRENEASRSLAEAQKIVQEQKNQAHYNNLMAQAENIRKTFPDFDLNNELGLNTDIPTVEQRKFYELTAPDGIFANNILDAYYAIHHREIEQAKIAQTARAASAAISNSIQSGRNMPQENGTVNKGSAPIRPRLYSEMDAEQRKQFERDLMLGRR